MKEWWNHRWLVECDDETYSRGTRAEARALAKRLNRHPANHNIRLFGPYANVDGIARIVDLNGPDVDRLRKGLPAFWRDHN